MNWMGGVRNRIKVQNERKQQKEFFERKKFQQRTQHLRKSPDVSKRRGINLDLLSIRTINKTRGETKIEKESDSKNKADGEVRRERRISRVDLDLSSSRRTFTTNLELPNMSPIKTISRLRLGDRDQGTTVNSSTSHTEGREPDKWGRSDHPVDVNPTLVDTFITPDSRVRPQHASHFPIDNFDSQGWRSDFGDSERSLFGSSNIKPSRPYKPCSPYELSAAEPETPYLFYSTPAPTSSRNLHKSRGWHPQGPLTSTPLTTGNRPAEMSMPPPVLSPPQFHPRPVHEQSARKRFGDGVKHVEDFKMTPLRKYARTGFGQISKRNQKVPQVASGKNLLDDDWFNRDHPRITFSDRHQGAGLPEQPRLASEAPSIVDYLPVSATFPEARAIGGLHEIPATRSSEPDQRNFGVPENKNCEGFMLRSEKGDEMEIKDINSLPGQIRTNYHHEQPTEPSTLSYNNVESSSNFTLRNIQKNDDKCSDVKLNEDMNKPISSHERVLPCQTPSRAVGKLTTDWMVFLSGGPKRTDHPASVTNKSSDWDTDVLLNGSVPRCETERHEDPLSKIVHSHSIISGLEFSSDESSESLMQKITLGGDELPLWVALNRNTKEPSPRSSEKELSENTTLPTYTTEGKLSLDKTKLEKVGEGQINLLAVTPSVGKLARDKTSIPRNTSKESEETVNSTTPTAMETKEETDSCQEKLRSSCGVLVSSTSVEMLGEQSSGADRDVGVENPEGSFSVKDSSAGDLLCSQALKVEDESLNYLETEAVVPGRIKQFLKGIIDEVVARIQERDEKVAVNPKYLAETLKANNDDKKDYISNRGPYVGGESLLLHSTPDLIPTSYKYSHSMQKLSSSPDVSVHPHGIAGLELSSEEAAVTAEPNSTSRDSQGHKAPVNSDLREIMPHSQGKLNNGFLSGICDLVSVSGDHEPESKCKSESEVGVLEPFQKNSSDVSAVNDISPAGSFVHQSVQTEVCLTSDAFTQTNGKESSLTSAKRDVATSPFLIQLDRET